MNFILKILYWIEQIDRRGKMAQAKRIDDKDDKWCNSAYE